MEIRVLSLEELHINRMVRWQLQIKGYRVTKVENIDIENMTCAVRYFWINDEHETYNKTVKLKLYEQT